MKKRILLTTTVCAFIYAANVKAQTAFNTIEYLDINNIRSAVLVHGDMWWDPTTSTPACEFPKGSGRYLSQATSLWMGGYDGLGTLHTSAQTYRQTGNDYWPGPLDNSGNLSYIQSEAWAKIWKVNKSEIEAFKTITRHTPANTPPSILEWPAKGNPYAVGNNGVPLTIEKDMAPFVDVDGDGNYDATWGDYPDIKGDQALWWVFSDNGPTHNHQAGTSLPLRVEVHAMAYAYEASNAFGNAQFYQFDVHNNSPESYTDFVLGFSSDVDLGYFNDDFIGFDSTLRMGIVYNGNASDGDGNNGSYGNMIPQMGVMLIETPGDGVSPMPLGSFMYYNNDFTVLGNPTKAEDFYRYMTATWLDGTHVKNDFSGPGNPSRGFGAGPDANYVFPDNPANNIQWSECVSGNPPGDRRFILGTPATTLSSGGVASYVFATVATTPGPNIGCINFNTIQNEGEILLTGTPSTGITGVNATGNLKLFPNPTSDKLYFNTIGKGVDRLTICNMMGGKVKLPFSIDNDVVVVNVQALPAGIYSVQYQSGGIIYANTFVKE